MCIAHLVPTEVLDVFWNASWQWSGLTVKKYVYYYYMKVLSMKNQKTKEVIDNGVLKSNEIIDDSISLHPYSCKKCAQHCIICEIMPMEKTTLCHVRWSKLKSVVNRQAGWI